MLDTTDEMLGLINMGSNIEIDIQKKSLLLKKGIKELQNILGHIHLGAKKASNNKLIFIKRSVDKLNTVSRYLSNLELPNTKEVRESSFDKEVTELYDTTVKNIDTAVKNISKMQALFKKQEAAEKKDLQYKGRFFSEQKNLDNLRLAHSSIRQLGMGLRMSKQDWNEIEKK